MPSRTVLDALTAAIAAAWPHTPIVAPNETGAVPDDGSAFLSVQFPFADERQITIGAPGRNVFREEGGVRCVLAIPIGTGLAPWLGRLDDLRATLRGKQFAGGTISTWAPSPVTIADATDDGAYALLSFAAPYHADLLG